MTNKKPSAKARMHVEAYARFNAVHNQSGRDMRNQKKLLRYLLMESGFECGDSFDQQVVIDDQVVGFHVMVDEPVTRVVDVIKLIEMVGVDKVLKVAMVTHQAVVDSFGNDVLNSCLVDTYGDLDVIIRKTKS